MRAERGKEKRHAPENSDVYQATGWRLEQAPITSTGWQGRHALPSERGKLARMLAEHSSELMGVLAGFTRIYYDAS